MPSSTLIRRIVEERGGRSMRLFTRQIQLSGPPLEIAAYAADMREFVSKKTGVEIGLWNVQFGAPLGTMIYSARVEGLAQLATITDTLMADPKYHEKLAKGADYVAGPAEDSLAQAIHGGEGDAPPVGTVITATRAVISNGMYADAVAWGVEMAIHSEKITGYPVGFFMDTFGAFGAVAWLSGAPNVGEVEKAGDALNADPSYQGKLSAVKDLFLPGSGLRTLATRVA
jgi:hypothetical protein